MLGRLCCGSSANAPAGCSVLPLPFVTILTMPTVTIVTWPTATVLTRPTGTKLTRPLFYLLLPCHAHTPPRRLCSAECLRQGWEQGGHKEECAGLKQQREESEEAGQGSASSSAWLWDASTSSCWTSPQQSLWGQANSGRCGAQAPAAVGRARPKQSLWGPSTSSCGCARSSREPEAAVRSKHKKTKSQTIPVAWEDVWSLGKFWQAGCELILG